MQKYKHIEYSKIKISDYQKSELYYSFSRCPDFLLKEMLYYGDFKKLIKIKYFITIPKPKDEDSIIIKFTAFRRKNSWQFVFESGNIEGMRELLLVKIHSVLQVRHHLISKLLCDQRIKGWEYI